MKTAVKSLHTLLPALWVVLALAGPAPAQGQPTGDPYLVRDLGPESSIADRQTNPSDGLEVDGRLLVAWSGQGYGVLWSTDGTASGSRSVLDVRSTLGAVAATDTFALFVEPRFTPRFRGEGVPPLGARLWSSDGTVAGTRPVVSVDGNVGGGHVLDELVVFAVEDGADEGLWATDGTAAGTRRLAAADALLFQMDTGIELSSGRLVFVDERVGDRRLWSTDGTPEGTFPIEATGAGAVFDGIAWVRSATDGDEVLFVAETSAAGEELFATDGTVAGTRLVAEIVPGPGGAGFLLGPVYEPESDLFYLFALEGFTSDGDVDVYQASLEGEVRQVASTDSQSRTDLALAVHEGRVLYGLDDGTLWAIPGPDAAPVLLADTIPDGTAGSVEQIVTGIGEVAYAIVSSGPARDRSLWVTDGTPATTRVYGDPCPAPCQQEGFGFQLFPGGFAFATSQDGGTVDLYRLDPGGLVRLTEFGPGREGVSQFLGLVDGRAIVRAYTLDDENRRRTQTLTSDGTVAGTFTLPPTPRRDIEPSSIAEMVAFGDLAAFTEDRFLISLYPYPRPAGDRLWLSDGTAAGTRVVDAATSVGTLRGTGFFDLQVQGDRLVYLGVAEGPGGEPHWEVRSTRADGTSRSLLLVDQAVPDPRPVREPTIGLARSAGRVYLRTEAGFRILAPGADDFGPLMPVRWFTDHVVDPRPEDDNDDSRPVRLGGDDLFLTGPFTDPADGWELWSSDGTAAGSRSLAAGNGGAHDLVLVGDRAYFLVDAAGGSVIWSTDGTVAGTDPLADPLPGAPEVAEIHQLHGAGGVLYVETERDDGTPDLWAIGDASGPDANALRVLSARHVLGGEEDASGRLVFVAAPPLGAAGRAARSDGTVAGTVVDAAGPEVLEPRPETFEVVGDRLFLAGFDVLHGSEPWRVSLDSGQSARLGDVFPGVGSSGPGHLTAVGDLLFFEAGAPEVGRELFAVPISGTGGGGGGETPPRPDTEPLTSPAVPGFRFWVEITPQGRSPLVGSAEGACIPETLCVSGALPGRTEVFLRVIGPRPNGLLWPVITRFTPSRVEVWIEQVSTGDLRYYDLAATDPDATTGDLTGLFDRNGFTP